MQIGITYDSHLFNYMCFSRSYIIEQVFIMYNMILFLNKPSYM